MEPQIRKSKPKRRWAPANQIDLPKIRAELDATQRQARRQAIIDAAKTPRVQPTPDKEFSAILNDLCCLGLSDIVARLEKIVRRPIKLKRGQPTAAVQERHHRFAIEVQTEIVQGRRKKAAYSIVASLNKVHEATVRRANAAYYWHALIAV
jgi:hypothetical protein